jgi:Asp-tRNA(Asn)/Glu-tRNA(Gln) amidotransferase B subunit
MKRKELANYIINKKPDLNKISPEELLKIVSAANKISDIDEDKLNEIIDKVLGENAKAVEDFKSGKETVIMFLVGAVMRQFPEKIDAGKVKASLLAKLK